MLKVNEAVNSSELVFALLVWCRIVLYFRVITADLSVDEKLQIKRHYVRKITKGKFGKP